MFPFILFNVFNNLLHGISRAVGSGTLMFISTLIYAISYAVYAYILFANIPSEIKIYCVHLALGGAYITELAFSTFIFVTGRSKYPKYKEIEKS